MARKGRLSEHQVSEMKKSLLACRTDDENHVLSPNYSLNSATMAAIKLLN